MSIKKKKKFYSALPDRKPLSLTFKVQIKENSLFPNQLLQKRIAFHSTLKAPSDGKTMLVKA